MQNTDFDGVLGSGGHYRDQREGESGRCDQPAAAFWLSRGWRVSGHGDALRFRGSAEEHSFRDWYRKGCAKFASPNKHMKPFAESPEIAIFDSFTDRELRCFSVQ